MTTCAALILGTNKDSNCLDEAKTLAGYFGLSNMFTPTRANPSIHLCRHEFQRDIRRTHR
jgi:hypothetical protein